MAQKIIITHYNGCGDINHTTIRQTTRQLRLGIRQPPQPTAGEIRIEALADEHLRGLQVHKTIGLHLYPIEFYLTDAANDEGRVIQLNGNELPELHGNAHHGLLYVGRGKIGQVALTETHALKLGCMGRVTGRGLVRLLHIGRRDKIEAVHTGIQNILQCVALHPFRRRTTNKPKQSGVCAQVYERIEYGKVADALGGFGAYEHRLSVTGQRIDEGGAVALLELLYLLQVNVHGLLCLIQLLFYFFPVGEK